MAAAEDSHESNVWKWRWICTSGAVEEERLVLENEKLGLAVDGDFGVRVNAEVIKLENSVGHVVNTTPVFIKRCGGIDGMGLISPNYISPDFVCDPPNSMTSPWFRTYLLILSPIKDRDRELLFKNKSEFCECENRSTLTSRLPQRRPARSTMCCR